LLRKPTMKLKLLALVIFVFLLLPLSLLAQPSGTSVKRYIRSLENRFHISFSYDSDLLEGVPFPLDRDTTGYDLKKLLEYMAEKSAFQLQYINDTMLIVRPKQEGANYKLQGRIIDKETGESLAGCYVSNTQKTFATLTDEKGEFERYIRYDKNDTLVFTTMGYTSTLIPMESFASKGMPAIPLKEKIIESDEVTVTAYMSDGIKFNRLNNSIQIKPKDLALLPGQTDADLLLSLDALPGISSPDGKAGNLNIRGSSSDQTLITFDNIPIYHKGHYFGTLSPFNPKVVEDLNVSRSSFTADKGGRAGGMIDIRTRQSIPDTALSGVALSTVDASAYTNLPVIKKKLSVLLAGRTSYPYNWMSPKLKSISNFVFQNTDLERAHQDPNFHEQDFRYNFYDWNAKVIAKPTDKQTFSVSFLKIFNQLDAKILNSASRTMEYDSIGFNNWGVSGQWSSQWSKKVNSSVSVTKSYFKQEQILDVHSQQRDTLNSKTDFQNTVNDFDVTTETNISGRRKNFLKLGYDLHYHNLSYNHTMLVPPASSVTLLSNANQGYIHSLYTSYNLIGLKRFKASVGLRGNYFTLTKGYNLEPRLSLNYLLTQTITLKSSAGIQRQFVTQVAGLGIQTLGGLENMLWILCDGKQVPVIQSEQVMGGAMYEKNNWIIDVEAYYKNIDNVTVININDFSQTNSFFHGKSYTEGVDVLLRKGWKRLDTWVSYTLSRSMMQIDSIQSTSFPALNDQRHIVDVAATYKWRKWKFSAGWKYRSGMASIIGIRTRLLHGAPPNTTSGGRSTTPGPPPTNPDFYKDSDGNPFYQDRYPAFHQLDVSIVYQFPSKQKQWNSTIGASVSNLYNRKNIIEQQHIQVGPDNHLHLVTRYSIGFAPNVFVSFNF